MLLSSFSLPSSYLHSNLPTMPWSSLGASTMPLRGASGSSVHLAGDEKYINLWYFLSFSTIKKLIFCIFHVVKFDWCCVNVNCCCVTMNCCGFNYHEQMCYFELSLFYHELLLCYQLIKQQLWCYYGLLCVTINYCVLL